MSAYFVKRARNARRADLAVTLAVVVRARANDDDDHDHETGSPGGKTEAAGDFDREPRPPRSPFEFSETIMNEITLGRTARRYFYI